MCERSISQVPLHAWIGDQTPNPGACPYQKSNLQLSVTGWNCTLEIDKLYGMWIMYLDNAVSKKKKRNVVVTTFLRTSIVDLCASLGHSAGRANLITAPSCSWVSTPEDPRSGAGAPLRKLSAGSTQQHHCLVLLSTPSHTWLLSAWTWWVWIKYKIDTNFKDLLSAKSRISH